MIKDFNFNIEKTKYCKYSESEIILHVTHKDSDKKCSVLCNLVINNSDKIDNYANLNINYREPSFVINKITNGKRDRQSEREILISRTIDKSLRPLLGTLFNKAITFNIMLLNFNEDIDLVSISTLAAIFCFKSLYNINLACVKTAIKDNKLILFPSINDCYNSDGVFTITANKKEIFFLDIETNNYSVKDLYKYIKNSIKYCEEIIAIISEIKSANELPIENINLDIVEKLKITEKFDSLDFITQNNISFESFRRSINTKFCKNESRIRKSNGIRKISVQDGPIDKCNNVIFTRGETSVLGALTYCNDKFNVGETIRDEHNIISVYNFPGFATGNNNEKKSIRREISHADLIRASMQKIINRNTNIRTYAEVLSSNGSSSMASVCAISCAATKLGLLNEPVSGISIGMFRDYLKNKEHFIVDMNAIEDSFSEMDFKITCSSQGITAIRTDFKGYLSLKGLETALNLGFESCSEINNTLKKRGYVNNVQTMQIDIDQKKLGLFIGNGGKHIKELSAQTNTKIKTNQNGSIIINGENLDLIKLLIKPFQNISLKPKDKIAVLIKEDSEEESKKINTYFGEITLSQKVKFTKNQIINLIVKNWEERSCKLS